MNTLTKEIEKENNIPHFFGVNSSNNLFYDNTEYNESFYYNCLDELNVSNRDARLDDENKEINPQTNTEGKKTKDKSTDIKSNHIEKEKNENKFLGRKLSKHDSKNYSKNNESQKNEVNDEKNQSKKEEIISKIILPNYKLENYIKAFKANMLGYINITLRNLYEKCQFYKFDNEFGNMTFHLPNYKKYQGNAKQKDNKEFIKKQIKEVFQDYDVNEIEGTSRQKDNKNLIEKIYEIINFPSTAEQKALKDFLEMTIEKAIEKYYDSSEEFQDFKKNRKIKFFDRQFFKEKYRNYSLLEKNGFLKLVNEPYYCHNPK